MIHSLLALPMLLGCVICMVLTSTLGLGMYLVSYRFLARGRDGDEVKEIREATGNLFRVVGWLVSLLLSLTFADVFRQWIAIDTAIEGEAAAVVSLSEELRRLELGQAREIQHLLTEYTKSVVADDWPALADDDLSPRTEELLLQLGDAALKLETTTAIEAELRNRIIADLDLMSNYRLTRLQQAREKPPLILLVVMFGLVITMCCFGVYRPNRRLIVLVSLFTMFIGIVIFLILSMSDPFQGTLSVDPEPLEYALTKLQ